MKLPHGQVPPEILKEVIFKHLGSKRREVVVGQSYGLDGAIIQSWKQVTRYLYGPNHWCFRKNRMAGGKHKCERRRHLRRTTNLLLVLPFTARKRNKKNCENHREIRATVRTYRRQYGLYEGMSGKEFKRKFLEMPSCLEASSVYSEFTKGPIRPVNVTDKYLNGRTKTSKDFLMNLLLKTNGLIQCAYKVPSIEEGLILDGIVKDFRRG